MSAQPLANEPSGPKEPTTSPGTVAFPDPASKQTPPDTAPSQDEPVTGVRRSLTGQTFDDLELLNEIGHGGMGVVYKARQKGLDRVVAVKLLLAEHFAEPLHVARFHAEARAAACLAHPNIVQVYQIGQ